MKKIASLVKDLYFKEDRKVKFQQDKSLVANRLKMYRNILSVEFLHYCSSVQLNIHERNCFIAKRSIF